MDCNMVLERAINVAKAKGWSGNTVANGLLYSHDFAKCLFGEETVLVDGDSVHALLFRFKQIAVEHMGKLYNIPPSSREFKVSVFPPVSAICEDGADAPNGIVDIKEVTYKIEHMFAQIPFKTHRLDAMEITNTEPAWKYHLKKMVEFENPLVYIEQFLERGNNG